METDPHKGILGILKARIPPVLPQQAQRTDPASLWEEPPQDGEDPPVMEHVPVNTEGLNGYWISEPGSLPGRVVLFFHGGGFTLGSTADHAGLIRRISRACRSRVFSLDYRRAPEHPFPAAVDDAVAAYRWLIARGNMPHRIVPMGISAGGTLALALLLAARDRHLPLPPAAVCMSPVTDFTFPGGSIITNGETDWLTPEYLGRVRTAYLAGHDPSDPLASPVRGDLRGLPRLLIQAAMHEILFDDIMAFVDKARWAGIPARFEVWQEMFHCWQVFAGQIPEGQEAIEHAGRFVDGVLGT